MGSQYCRAQFVAEIGMLAEGSTTSRVQAIKWGTTVLKDAAIRQWCGKAGQVLLDERSVEQIPLNYAARDNEFDINAAHDHDGPAYGWLKGLDVLANDGLYLDVEWNKRGQKGIREGDWKYFSLEPLLEIVSRDDDGNPILGRVIAVTGGALTNRPAVGGLQPVELSQLPPELGLGGSGAVGDPPRKETDMSDTKWWEPLRRFFKGSDVNDATSATLAVADLSREAGQVATLTARVTELETAQAELSTQLVTKAAESAELTAKLTAAEAKVAELEGASKLTGIELAVQTAIDERQITPADKEWATKLAAADADLWAECLASRPKGSAGPAAGSNFSGTESPPVEGNPDDPAVRNLAIKQEQARLTTERGSPVTYEAAALSLEQQQKAARGGV
jgi:phage I-like protein